MAANLPAKIEPEVKVLAEGLSFDVKISSSGPIDLSALSEKQMNRNY